MRGTENCGLQWSWEPVRESVLERLLHGIASCHSGKGFAALLCQSRDLGCRDSGAVGRAPLTHPLTRPESVRRRGPELSAPDSQAAFLKTVQASSLLLICWVHFRTLECPLLCPSDPGEGWNTTGRPRPAAGWRWPGRENQNRGAGWKVEEKWENHEEHVDLRGKVQGGKPELTAMHLAGANGANPLRARSWELFGC